LQKLIEHPKVNLKLKNKAGRNVIQEAIYHKSDDVINFLTYDKKCKELFQDSCSDLETVTDLLTNDSFSNLTTTLDAQGLFEQTQIELVVNSEGLNVLQIAIDKEQNKALENLLEHKSIKSLLD